MDFSENLKTRIFELLSDRKARSIIILVVVVLVFLYFVWPLFFPEKFRFFRKRPVICEECGKEKIADIDSTASYKCPECGGRVSYIYKCVECDYEFPLKRVKRDRIPGIESMSPKEYLEFRVNESKCPNCDSVFTDPKRVAPEK
jgi:predicted RNA-binding Zn-ribbon protein involved in translation (DUF1610 family)